MRVGGGGPATPRNFEYSYVMAGRDEQQTQRCTRCGGNYLLEFFRYDGYVNRARGAINTMQRFRDRCIGCEAMRKREELADQRLRRKAIATRRRHGVKFKQLEMIRCEDDLEEVYGWSLDRMIDDIERAREKGCPYCLQTIERGLGMITLDILNAEQPQHYSTNVLWCCARCNSEKQRTPPQVWGARQSMWNLWHRNQIRLGTNPEEFGFLPLRTDEVDPSHTLW
jgi:hypothetical protein